MSRESVQVVRFDRVGARQFAIEMFETEILDLKGEIYDLAMKSYRRLLKFQDTPIYLKRNDDQLTTCTAENCGLAGALLP